MANVDWPDAVVARGDAPALFDLVEKPLDQIACSEEVSAEADRLDPIFVSVGCLPTERDRVLRLRDQLLGLIFPLPISSCQR